MCAIPIALDWDVHGCNSRQYMAIVIVNDTEQFKFQFCNSVDDFEIESGLP